MNTREYLEQIIHEKAENIKGGAYCKAHEIKDLADALATVRQIPPDNPVRIVELKNDNDVNPTPIIATIIACLALLAAVLAIFIR